MNRNTLPSLVFQSHLLILDGANQEIDWYSLRRKVSSYRRPIGRPRVAPQIEAAIAKALQQCKLGIHKIAAKHSVGVGVVQRIKAAL